MKREADFDDEIMANFCAVTGADEDSALHFLSAAAGDLEMAVSLYLDTNNNAAGAENTTQDASKAYREESVRAPIQPKRSVLVDDQEDSFPGHSISRYPQNPPMAFDSVVEPFRNFSVEAASTSSASRFKSPFLSPSPEVAEDEKGRRLAELFRPPTEIMFTEGGWEAARRKAKEDHRWLLLTIHHPLEFPCQQMVRDVWNDGTIQEFIRESLLFLFLTVGTTEAERYRQLYPFEHFPHWALIDPRTGKRVKSGSKVLKAPEMLMELVEWVSDHPLQSPTYKRNSPIDLGELEQLEEGSPETKRQNIVPIIVDENEDNGAGDDRTMVTTRKSPPLQLSEEPDANHPDAINIQFRLPDGSKHRRRFIQTDTVEALFSFVQSKDASLSSFDILSHTASLKEHLTDSLQSLKLKNATLTVVSQ